ncbi:hypothetical protein A3SI_02538 [Nitritalea halalkaliphila LW7]|uniref:DUF4221 domain-containing protein n=1 Tax=Nitritalea halalkaliphila LW7 TaxID=1189621 RepID=I5C9P0_9BACT|nr:DUF4221 family protein [Nitritalea halalkaliphila]EIM78542.1 hypothetical protein A3SI_02538 [Nitritalea halalkaliphila LW7]
MRHLRYFCFCLLAALLLFSCGPTASTSEQTFGTISFSLDTVMVDPGDEILNLKYGLFVSDLSEDKRFLYFWDPDNALINEIDLDALALRNQYRFEKEGPDGVGNTFVHSLNCYEEGFLIASFGARGYFSKAGKKLKDFRVQAESYAGDAQDLGQEYDHNPIVYANETKYVGLVQDWFSGTFALVLTDNEQRVRHKVVLPEIETLPDYTLMLRSDDLIEVQGSDKKLQRVGHQVIFSNSTYADLFVFDLLTDSMRRVSYRPTLTAAQKKGGYPKEVSSKKEMEDLWEQIHGEINFLPPLWDAERSLYYRLSYTVHKNPAYLPEVENAKKYTYRVYLTVLNSDFELVAESELAGMPFVPRRSIVKDGMLWSEINIDDELGFQRIRFDFGD